MLECWTVLAALATQTAAVSLGSLVLGNAYRHPAVVANMAVTLDHVSQGRLVLGIGAGWQPNEHAAYGIELPAARDRVAVLAEACAAYRLRDAPFDPRPLSRLTLLVGGGGRLVMGMAARHADVWHAWARPAGLARKNAVLDGLLRDIGRYPGDVARATGGTVAVRAGRDPERAAGEIEVQGTPEDILSQLLAFRDAGADEFIVRDDAANFSIEQALTQLDTLTQAVLPGLTR